MATFKDRLNRVFTPRPVKVSPKSRSRYEGGKYVADVEISQRPEVRAALKRAPLLGARLVETPKPHVEAISPCDASNAARRVESLSRRGDKVLTPREVMARRKSEGRVVEPPRAVTREHEGLQLPEIPGATVTWKDGLLILKITDEALVSKATLKLNGWNWATTRNAWIPGTLDGARHDAEQWAQMERGAKVLLTDLQAYVNKHKSDAQLAMEKKRAEWEEAALTRKKAADAHKALQDKEREEMIEKAIVDRHAEDQAFIASKLKGPTFKNSMSDKRYEWPSYVGVGDLVLSPAADDVEVIHNRMPFKVTGDYTKRYDMWPLSHQEYQINYAPTGARIFGAKSGVQARKVFEVFTHSPTLLSLLTWYTRRAGNPNAPPVKGAVEYDAPVVADTGKIPAFVKLLQQNTDVDLALSESGLGDVIEEVRQAKLRTGKKGILATNYTPAAVQIMANLRKLAKGKGKGGGRDDAGWIVDTIAVPDVMDAIQKTYSRLQGGASPEKCASAIDDFHVFYDAKKGRHHIKAGAVIVGQVERYLREHAGTPRAIAESLHTERMERIAQKGESSGEKLANDALMQAMMRSPGADAVLLSLGEKVLGKADMTPEEERAFADLPGPVSRKREALAKAILRSHKGGERASEEDRGAKPLGTFDLKLMGAKEAKPWPFYLRAGELVAHRMFTLPGRPVSAKWGVSNEKTGKLLIADIASKQAAGDALAWFAGSGGFVRAMDQNWPDADTVAAAKHRTALQNALQEGDILAAEQHKNALLASLKGKG